MSTIENHVEQLGKLRKEDLLLLFYKLLRNKSISFTELSEVYVNALEHEASDKQDLIAELGFSLLMFKDKITGGTWKQAEEKADKALVRSGLFRGTPWEEKTIKRLEK